MIIRKLRKHSNDADNTREKLSRRYFLQGKVTSDSNTSAQILETCLSINKIECRACEDACPEAAIRFIAQLGGHYRPYVETHSCTSCRECLSVCPVDAIVIAKKHSEGSGHGAS